jgi:hypothetical protein
LNLLVNVNESKENKLSFCSQTNEYLLLYVGFMSSNLSPLYGLIELQTKFIAICMADVPFMFFYVTPLVLIFTPYLRFTQSLVLGQWF